MKGVFDLASVVATYVQTLFHISEASNEIDHVTAPEFLYMTEYTPLLCVKVYSCHKAFSSTANSQFCHSFCQRVDVTGGLVMR